MLPAIFGVAGPALAPGERDFFRDARPAGYILFGRNVQDRAQLRRLTDSLRELEGRDDTLICIDQEGGRVARMKPPEWPAYPSGVEFDRLYELAPMTAIEAARANAEALGLDLAEAGISCNCLPLLDLRHAHAHDVIGDRALGADPLRVAALGRALLDGMADAGVVGIVKHIPGHGRARADSHKQLPTVDAGEDALAADIAPFRSLADAPIAMTAHIVYTAWDAERPATLSPLVIERIIRRRIGFDGLLLSDDIDMEALSGPIPARSAAAIAAGCDVVLNCWAKMDDMTGTAEALGAMSDRSAERLAKAMAPARIGWGAEQAERRAQCLARRDALLAIAAGA